MPAIALLGGRCSGHGDFPPRPTISGASTVFVNGKPVVRVGDRLAPHCNSDGCHPGSVAKGSSTVNVEGSPCARVGDKVDCGSVLAMGSPNVFAG